jgi:enoyl-CoA hydratase/carnithine racemase
MPAGEPLAAAEAERYGLVNELTASGIALDAALQLTPQRRSGNGFVPDGSNRRRNA